MLSNAGEWCNDWYNENYYKISPERNPHGPKKSEERSKVFRGGSFKAIGICGSRYYAYPNTKDESLGFRCVRNAPKEEKKKEKK